MQHSLRPPLCHLVDTIVLKTSFSHRYADGEFDKTGGHVSFEYVNSSLTIPRNLTEDMQAIRIYCMKEEDVEIPLSASEFLVSNVIRIESRLRGILKNPALLEIKCDVLKSRVEKFFELSMIQYDPVSKTWTDVEKSASVQRRFCKLNYTLAALLSVTFDH